MTKVSFLERPGLALLALILAAAIPASASVDLAILPAEMVQQPGDTILVELTVVNESDEFNAYDARVTYNPERLLFLQMTPVTDQEGPLMTEACPQRFHIFTIGPDSTYVEVNHSLLCAGVSVQGPGVVYQLQFECRNIEGQTELGFATPTTFYDAGVEIAEVNLAGATVEIGGTTAVLTPAAPPLQLHAAPNPFNPRTVLSFDLQAPRPVSLVIHDVAGRVVRTVFEGQLGSGPHRFAWDGLGDRGRPAAAGVYFAILDHGDGIMERKLTLVK